MARPSQMPKPPSKAALADNPELKPQPVPELDGSLPQLDAAEEPAPVEPAPAPVELPKAPSKKKLDVVANRAGIWKNERKKAGDKFQVNEDQLGSWMDCVNPVEQVKHQKRMQDRSRKMNAAAAKLDAKDLAADE